MEVRSSAEPGLTISATQTHAPTLRGLRTFLSQGGVKEDQLTTNGGTARITLETGVQTT